ncbi:MAG: copper transporter [Armatimonadetes bacterium]|nr:copper transporter [Armatimonadota bacterium]MDW8121950.1 copper transporter [Armatimonadota bacterium]
MNWDGRWFVISLVAVLIFFIIGVQVGIAVRQERMAQVLFQRIEDQLKRYRSETKELLRQRDEKIKALEIALKEQQRYVSISESFMESLLPALIKGSLVYRNVAIVTLSEDYDRTVMMKTRRSLETAGASVPIMVRWRTDNFLQAETPSLATAVDVRVAGSLSPDLEALRREVLKTFSFLLRQGDPGRRLSVFSRLGWLDFEGRLSGPVGSVVVIAGFREERPFEQVQTFDQPLVKELVSAGLKVIVAECRTLQGPSVVSTLSLDGLSTIDHLETPMGQWSLIAGLAGASGHFGLKDEGKRPYPKMDDLTMP